MTSPVVMSTQRFAAPAPNALKASGLIALRISRKYESGLAQAG
jgi:hypothetical protein